MSSSNEPVRPWPADPTGSGGLDGLGERVLHPAQAQARAVRPARLDADLRAGRWAHRYTADPRLVDPQLEAAFEQVAVQVREAARAEGYAAGWAAGRAAGAGEATRQSEQAEAALAAELAAIRSRATAALARLAAAADQLEATMAPPAGQVQALAVQLAADLTQTLVGHELAVATDPGMDALVRALALAPAGRTVQARLHPDDIAVLTGGSGEGPGEVVVAGRPVRLLADANVEPGGAVVDCDATRIDAQLGPALDRVRAVLAAAASALGGDREH